MKRNFFYCFLIIGLIIFSCTALKMEKALFNVTDAYYQAWMNKKENGTNIYVELSHIENGIVFDSLVFRGVRLPVFAERENDKILLKALLNEKPSVLPVDKKVVPEKNGVIYTYRGKRYSYPIEKFHSRKMEYNH